MFGQKFWFIAACLFQTDSAPLNDLEQADNSETGSVNAETQLFEGDIDGIDPQFILSVGPTLNNGVSNEELRWKNGTIPYTLSEAYTPPDRGVILKAMTEYQEKTCIKFTPRAEENDWIDISPGLTCSSFVGRIGGRQRVSLATPGCMKNGQIQHELMHAAGFVHEQSRTDRDSYVEINANNLREADLRYNFAKYTDEIITAFNQPYDYGSVMHYGRNFFAIDKTSWTIRPKPPNENVETGQRLGLSPIDVTKINLMYKCPENNLQKASTSQTTTQRSTTPKVTMPSTASFTCGHWHTIASGDICVDLWSKYRLAKEEFEEWNPKVDCDMLEIGQKLCVDTKERQQTNFLCKKWSLVKKGDSCWATWTSNGITQSEFTSWNPTVRCNLLKPGDKLCVSRSSTGASETELEDSSSCQSTYSTREGDDCGFITKSFHLTLALLEGANDKLDCTKLPVGKPLCIP